MARLIGTRAVLKDVELRRLTRGQDTFIASETALGEWLPIAQIRCRGHW